MENGNGGGAETISCEDVISKLKDDGDFDRLRLKIIRKLKENEELRNTIVSIVKQSVALNRPGAENMKPRQLSDAIHQEVGYKVNEHIFNGLWEIIRSPDGINTEITETVKSIYSKLLTPKRVEDPEPSGHDPKRACKEDHQQVNGVSESELKEPPGFSQTVSHQIGIRLPEEQEQQQQQKQTLHQSKQVLEKKHTVDPPGFSAGVEQKDEVADGSDDEPDAPPRYSLLKISRNKKCREYNEDGPLKSGAEEVEMKKGIGIVLRLWGVAHRGDTPTTCHITSTSAPISLTTTTTKLLEWFKREEGEGTVTSKESNNRMVSWLGISGGRCRMPRVAWKALGQCTRAAAPAM